MNAAVDVVVFVTYGAAHQESKGVTRVRLDLFGEKGLRVVERNQLTGRHPAPQALRAHHDQRLVSFDPFEAAHVAHAPRHDLLIATSQAKVGGLLHEERSAVLTVVPSMPPDEQLESQSFRKVTTVRRRADDHRASAVTKPKRVICRMTEPLESQAVCLFRRHQHSPQ